MFTSVRILTRLAALCAVPLTLIATPAAADDEFPNDLAAQDGATLLQSAGPWNLDFGENRCRLARTFGTEEEPNILIVEQSAPDPSFSVVISGPDIARFRNSTRLNLGMNREQPMQRIGSTNAGDMPSFGPAIIVSSFGLGTVFDPASLHPAGINPNDAEKVDRVVLQRGKRVLSLETGNMKAAFEALNECTYDLLRDWGLDPVKHRSFISPIWTNESAVARRIVANYPSKGLRAGEQAIFRVRVIIEKDGTVSDCFTDKATATEKLETPACTEMVRATFEPAKDAQGSPMRSFYSTNITYQIN